MSVLVQDPFCRRLVIPRDGDVLLDVVVYSSIPVEVRLMSYQTVVDGMTLDGRICTKKRMCPFPSSGLGFVMLQSNGLRVEVASGAANDEIEKEAWNAWKEDGRDDIVRIMYRFAIVDSPLRRKMARVGEGLKFVHRDGSTWYVANPGDCHNAFLARSE